MILDALVCLIPFQFVELSNYTRAIRKCPAMSIRSSHKGNVVNLSVSWVSPGCMAHLGSWLQALSAY